MAFTDFSMKVDLLVYVENQAKGWDTGSEHFFNNSASLNSLRYAVASNFSEGKKRDSFLAYWDRAVEAVTEGELVSDRFVMTPTDDADTVIIIKIQQD